MRRGTVLSRELYQRVPSLPARVLRRRTGAHKLYALRHRRSGTRQRLHRVRRVFGGAIQSKCHYGVHQLFRWALRSQDLANALLRLYTWRGGTCQRLHDVRRVFGGAIQSKWLHSVPKLLRWPLRQQDLAKPLLAVRCGVRGQH